MSVDESVPPSALAILDRVYKHFSSVASGATFPAVQGLPIEIREQEVPATMRLYMTLSLRALRDRRSLQESDLEGARERGAQRAEEGVPLTLVLHNWYYGARVFLEACTDAAREGEVEGLSYIARQFFGLHETMVRAVVEAYQDERAVISREDHGAEHLLASLLISGQDAADEAERFGVSLAPAYAILAVSFGTLPDEKSDDPTGRQVAGRRKIRQINRALVRRDREPVLALLEPSGGQVLVPGEGDRAEAAEFGAELVDRMAAAAGVAVVGAFVEEAVVEHLPANSLLAREILDLALVEGRPPGLYRMADVALSYQLTRRTAGSEHLLTLLAPLEPFPELLDTLQSYYDHNLDRAPTARALHVHPNTVNNRINRIAELVGHDPNDVTAIMRLGAALEIRRTGSRSAG